MGYVLMALFRSMHQALLFAHTYAPNQHARAAAAERIIATFAKGRYEPDATEIAIALTEPRGLIGLDGATQSGMIKSAVSKLKIYERHVIMARFGFLEYEKNAEARAAIAMRIARVYGLEEMQAGWSVKACYGMKKVAIDQLEKLGLSKKSKSYETIGLARDFISKLEQSAFDALEPKFINHGLID
jgi:hypothetical protein